MSQHFETTPGGIGQPLSDTLERSLWTLTKASAQALPEGESMSHELPISFEMSDLKSSIEIVMASSPFDEHPIPPITHPFGVYWEQPDRHLIELDATHAMMTRATLMALPEYSCSQPSGVYPGKMWRRRKIYHKDCDDWLLLWFGFSELGENYCTTFCRQVLIIE